MKNKKNTHKLYILAGIIITFICFFLFALFITLPIAIKDLPEYFAWISIVCCMVSFVGIVFGAYLYKKGNFIKLNNTKTGDNEFKNKSKLD